MTTETRDLREVLKEERLNWGNVSTSTTDEQVNVEDSVCPLFQLFISNSDLDPFGPYLDRQSHINYLKKGLSSLPEKFQVLDASRPWMVYWCLHALDLLEEQIPVDLSDRLLDFLSRCQNECGGFGGGPSQSSHLAPTYAAINAICIIGTERAYRVINRKSLYNFMESVKQPDGSFIMHENGEVDIRGAYCALAVARLTGIYTDELFNNTHHWLLRCQTYEGGFGGVPGMEAHGGYTFCGLAALCLLNKSHLVNMDSLLRWSVNRQMRLEGGFQGRTNKLVDGCYSFWLGGIFPLIHGILLQTDNDSLSKSKWLFNQEALQEYILICCQNASGGLLDKPKKPPDYYHTCYVLSGLSMAQHFAMTKYSHICCIGDPSNQLRMTHPVLNMSMLCASAAANFFNSLPPVEDLS